MLPVHAVPTTHRLCGKLRIVGRWQKRDKRSRVAQLLDSNRCLGTESRKRKVCGYPKKSDWY